MRKWLNYELVLTLALVVGTVPAWAGKPKYGADRKIPKKAEKVGVFSTIGPYTYNKTNWRFEKDWADEILQSMGRRESEMYLQISYTSIKHPVVMVHVSEYKHEQWLQHEIAFYGLTLDDKNLVQQHGGNLVVERNGQEWMWTSDKKYMLHIYESPPKDTETRGADVILMTYLKKFPSDLPPDLFGNPEYNYEKEEVTRQLDYLRRGWPLIRYRNKMRQQIIAGVRQFCDYKTAQKILMDLPLDGSRTRDETLRQWAFLAHKKWLSKKDDRECVGKW